MSNNELNKDLVRELVIYLQDRISYFENEGFIIDDIVPDVNSNTINLKCHKPIKEISVNIILHKNGESEIINTNDFTNDSFYWNDQF